MVQYHGSNIEQNVLIGCRVSFFAFRSFSSVPAGQARANLLVIVLTKSASASILSYLLHEERKIFAKIYLV